jgi:hypothetical protein
MVTLTISFNPNESNAEILAQVVRLLAGVEANHHPASTSEENPTGISVEPQKAKKSRKPLTEAEKEVIRQRFAKGRIEAAKKRGDDPRPEDLETMDKASSKKAKVAGSKKMSKAKMVVKSEQKLPMPRNGRKIGASPASQ